MPAATCSTAAATRWRSTESMSGKAASTCSGRIGRRGGGTRSAKRWYHEAMSHMAEFKGAPLHSSVSEAVTGNVRVEVQSEYYAPQSQPLRQTWMFHYTVRITNERSERVQLVSRHWIITDAKG